MTGIIFQRPVNEPGYFENARNDRPFHHPCRFFFRLFCNNNGLRWRVDGGGGGSRRWPGWNGDRRRRFFLSRKTLSCHLTPSFFLFDQVEITFDGAPHNKRMVIEWFCQSRYHQPEYIDAAVILVECPHLHQYGEC